MSEYMDKARAGWGEDLPEWIAAIATACEQTSQNKVATRIGYSAAVVSLVLKAEYTGNLTKVERAVKASLLDARVECPVSGDIAMTDCIANQKPATRFTNQLQIKFLRTCPTCPNGGKSNAE